MKYKITGNNIKLYSDAIEIKLLSGKTVYFMVCELNVPCKLDSYKTINNFGGVPVRNISEVSIFTNGLNMIKELKFKYDIRIPKDYIEKIYIENTLVYEKVEDYG